MSLSAWEQQALDSIKDGLAGSDPELAALLVTFTRLAIDEEMPARTTMRTRSRRAFERSRRRRHRDRAGGAYQRLRSRHALLSWLLVTLVMIGVAVALSRSDGQPGCSRSWWGAACTSPASASGPPLAGQAAPVGHVPG